MNIYSEKTNQLIRPATQTEINYWNASQQVDLGCALSGYLFLLFRHDFVYLA